MECESPVIRASRDRLHANGVGAKSKPAGYGGGIDTGWGIHHRQYG